MGELLEFLMIMDRELPWEDFYKDTGGELFSMFFKMTYYGKDIENSVFNKDKESKDDDVRMQKVITDHDSLCWIIQNFKRLEYQVNYVINNFLIKQIHQVKNKMELLINMAPLLYSAGGEKNSKRVGKIMMLFATMCATMQEQGEMNNDKHRFLMGSLYALGGLLKIESKSYLMTLNEYYTKNPEGNKEKYKLVCPLTNAENQMEENEAVHIRHLSLDEVEFFKTVFVYIVIYFIKCVLLGTPKHAINNDNNDLLLNLT